MSKGGNIKVVARVRPTNELEIKKGGVEAVRLLSETEIEVTCDDGEFRFTFDHVLATTSTQLQAFECVAAPIVEDVLQGYNATIFAYGQTSSGKTFTMEGPSITDPELRGIIPRTVSSLFKGVAVADANIEFTVKVAYIEIYLERIRDLLDSYHTKINLSVREDPQTGVYVAGVTEEYCTCEAELLEVMSKGAANRAVAATGMNEGSSRSHSVFMVTVTQRNLETTALRAGKLFLVDLAGSEMVRKTNATGQQLEEAKTINKSLSALGLVINALTEERPTHVPYRDSKLTRVLQDSLGGNAKTSLLINCSPSSYNAMETLSTLRFGSRAKKIMNKPKINEQRSVEEMAALLQKAENAIDMQQSYIMALEGQLRADGGGGSGEGAGGGGDDAVHLQSKVVGLSAELAEEREESARAQLETTKLGVLLREKERLLADAGALLGAAEKYCDEARARADLLEGEQQRASEEASAAAEALREAEARHEFEASELKVSIEKLSAAKSKLEIELEKSETSGDGSVTTAHGEWPLLDDEALATAMLKFGPDAGSFVAEREASWIKWATALRQRAAGEDIRELESSKARLAADLQLSAEKNMELEMMLAQLSGGADAEKILARERNQQKMQKKFESLQQRLEQLVAVHRQLLRKYAALELDNAEDKKKISLRDERIAQLEANTRTLAMNMRTQAARHVVELTKLREQVSTVRQEQIRTDHADHSRSVRGAGSVRAIRGGGGEPTAPR